MNLTYLQNYWWLLISALGAMLVVMLFVQGGQTMLPRTHNTIHKSLIVNSLGKKWELTFTTLVVFGGAFFASFPLFYSTSFGGAYWLWISILLSFIMQAVSYEYRSKPGNIYGTTTYDWFLFVNGCAGCILLGVAVSMFFFGGEFTVTRGNLLDTNAPVISQWAHTHGLEAIFNCKNLILGVAILFLARMNACLFMMNDITHDTEFFHMLKHRCRINGGIFILFFILFLSLLFISTGYESSLNPDYSVSVVEIRHKYFHNYQQMWWAAISLLTGALLVVYALLRSTFSKRWTKGFWFSATGTLLVVLSLFWVAAFNETPFYPSISDPSSSLSIRNSSSSEFTLKTMAYVSLVIPITVAYIAYVWHSMGKKKLTPEELEHTSHKY